MTTLNSEQTTAVESICEAQSTLVCGAAGSGKCLAPQVKVLHYDGTVTRADQVKVGDSLMGPDSKPRKVLSTCRGTAPMFRIQPTRGNAWECNDVHVLTVVDSTTDAIIDVPLNDFQLWVRSKQKESKLFTVGVDWPMPPEVTLDPWFAGIWYGDGNKDLTSCMVTTPDPEVIAGLEQIALRYGLHVARQPDPRSKADGYRLTQGSAKGIPRDQRGNPITVRLREMYSTQSLPRQYILGSRETRLQFLAGLLDSDGYLHCNYFELLSRHAGWANDIVFLARSLGFYAKISEKSGPRGYEDRTYYRLAISGHTDAIPTRVKRKQAAPRQQIKVATRTGFTYEPCGTGEYFGWTLDGDGRFLLADFTVTHNTTTLRSAIEALEKAGKRYMLLAPTGKAALRMRAATQRNASTIHKILFAKNADSSFSNVDVVIVDEASMVDSELMGELCKKLLLFGCRLALVGDPNQLPPVGPGKPFEDALSAAPAGVSRIVLKTIYRQQGDSWVLDNAHKILAGEMVSLEDTHDFRFIETDDITDEVMAYLGRMWESGNHPSTFQVISPQRVDNRQYDSGATTERVNSVVQEVTTADGPGVFEFEWGRKFRTGDRVIQTSNNYKVGVVNGQQGVVITADLDGVRVKFDEATDEDAIVLYSITSSECPHPRELDLAFAITCHRAQGSQWANLLFVADLKHTRMLQQRLFYTAVTRTEKFLTIVGSRDAIERAVRTNLPNDRRTLLQEKLTGKVAWVGEARL